jgi:hypothetical protein
LIAHNVADHWVQTDAQARDKSLPGWPGRLACLAHVASYTGVLTVFAGFLWIVFDLPISPLGLITGLVVSAISHYWADRRFTLAKLCQNLGKEKFYNLGAPRKVMAMPATLPNSAEVVLLYKANYESTRLLDNHPSVSWDNPSLGTGAYALDQSWHWFWIFVTTIVMVML